MRREVPELKRRRKGKVRLREPRSGQIRYSKKLNSKELIHSQQLPTGKWEITFVEGFVGHPGCEWNIYRRGYISAYI